MKRIYNVKITRIPQQKLKYKLFDKTTIPLPKSVDLRKKCPPVYDQGELGSCTANAIGACYEFGDNNAFIPSRLFIYYNERKLEHSISEDAGAELSDGIKTVQKYGVCPENMWAYDITKFTKCPPTRCYTNALKHKALEVHNITQTETDMKLSLSQGYPFVVGIGVYESFESDVVAKTGIVPLPNTSKEKCLGGHAILCVGYDDSKKVWIMRNSWGEGWGDKGYFTLPYAYLLTPSLSSDLWNITKVTPSTLKVENQVDSIEIQIAVISHKLDQILDRLA